MPTIEERAARLLDEINNALDDASFAGDRPKKAATAVIARDRAELVARIEALEEEVERLRRNVRGWVEWHRRCDADDDCTYLNDNAWCDAEALASTGMGLLARTALGASHDA